MKYENNKYYTQTKTIEKMVDIIKNNLKIEDITEIIEPSAGDGRFYPYLKELCDNVYMYDIEPDNDLVEKQDFLKLDIEYKKGRIVVGNPPFGYRGILYKQFIIKSLKIADYVVFILPSTNYNKNDYYYKKSKLIYSELLLNEKYNTIGDDVEVDTVINIYTSKENEIDDYDFKFMEKDLELYIIRKKYDFTYKNCDFYICSYGYSQGKLYYEIKHNNVLGIIILNEDLRTDLTTFFENMDKNYNPERKIIDKTGKSTYFTKIFIQKKLKKDFYKK